MNDLQQKTSDNTPLTKIKFGSITSDVDGTEEINYDIYPDVTKPNVDIISEAFEQDSRRYPGYFKYDEEVTL